MKFFSPKVAFYLYKSTIQPCTKFYWHVWAGVPIGYLHVLAKLEKQV